MRVRKGFRGLIVDEGRLNGLIVDEGRHAMGGLIVDEGRHAMGAYGDLEMNRAVRFGLAAVSGVAAYLLWTHGWRKLGGFMGFSAAGSAVWAAFGTET